MRAGRPRSQAGMGAPLRAPGYDSYRLTNEHGRMATTKPGCNRATWRKRRTAATLIAAALAGGLLAAVEWLAPFAREARLRWLDVAALRREARARPNDPETFL